MVELNIEQLEEVNGGVLPLLAAHFLFNASTAASVYTVACSGKVILENKR